METKKDIYMISLDGADLNSLPISQRHSDSGAVPLWNMRHLDMRKNNYYEFVIKADDTEESLSEPVIKHVTCHICDINVPEVYFNEHKNGFRHKFNRKVTDTALKRLQMYMDKDYIEHENNEKLPSKHFCVECSIVINSEDETSHKQTTAHRNSVLFERLLNDFLIIYTSDDNEAVDNNNNKSKDVTTEPVKESKNSKQEYILDEPITEETLTINSITNSDEQKSFTETNMIKEKEESIKEVVKETKEDKRTDKKIPKPNSCNLQEDLQNGEVLFYINDGSKEIHFKVSDVYYNALVAISESFELCMICNCTYNVKDRGIHVKSRLHSDNLRATPLDKNCVRQINRTHHHCALCNDYFTEYDSHVASKEHLTNFKCQMIMYDSDKTDKTDLDNDDCNKDETIHDPEDNDASRIDDTEGLADVNKKTDPVDKVTSNSLKQSNSTSVPEYTTVLCDTCNVWMSKEQFGKHRENSRHIFNAISDYHYLLKLSKDNDSVYCLVCKRPILNEIESIKQHFSCRDHVKKHYKLLKAHSIFRRYEKKYYCKQCEVYILNKNEYMHIKTKQHSEKVGLYELDDGDEQRDVTLFFNSYADTARADDTNAAPVDRNTSGANSGTATDTVTFDPAISTALEAVNQINTDIRSIKFDWETVTDNIVKNVCNRVKEVFDKWESREIPADVSDTTESDESVVTVKSYVCTVCNVKVPNNDRNISEHNRGRSHNFNLPRRVDQR